MSFLMDELLKHIQKKQFFTGRGLVLAAVSGGADSVALLSLLKEMALPLHALHCNFHLRGEESDRDEAFVRQLCRQLDVPLTVATFDTASFAKEKGISIEMAARDQRYEFFKRQAEEKGAEAVAVAHHLDDQAETLLLNLLRGTGLRGLAAMKPRSGIIVRPLLDVRRTDLITYLEEKGLTYVTDSSNLERDARRNRIRLDVMPLLRQINPRADEALAQTARIVRESLPIYDEAVRRRFDEAGVTPTSLPLSFLRDAGDEAPALLHEWLSDWGFNSSQEAEILRSLETTPGRMWMSPKASLLLDRKELFIRPSAETEAENALQLNLRQTEVDKIGETGPMIAYFDAEKLNQPLRLRTPRPGDFFYPLGLGGRKLLSDFMTDHHLTRFQKQTQPLLCHGDDIIWVIGLRSDHRYRVTKDSKAIVKIEIEIKDNF